eukprot:scpid91426/ scgid5138/ 
MTMSASEMKSGSQKSGSPKSGSHKSGSPKSGSPKSGSTECGTPQRGSPDTGMPECGSTESSSMGRRSLKGEHVQERLVHELEPQVQPVQDQEPKVSSGTRKRRIGHTLILKSDTPKNCQANQTNAHDRILKSRTPTSRSQTHNSGMGSPNRGERDAQQRDGVAQQRGAGRPTAGSGPSAVGVGCYRPRLESTWRGAPARILIPNLTIETIIPCICSECELTEIGQFALRFLACKTNIQVAKIPS